MSPAQSVQQFAAYLREHGFVIGLAELQAMLQMALWTKIDRPERLQKYWRGIACSSQKQWRQFPDLFEAYWFPERIKGKVRSSQKKRSGKSLHELIQEIQGQGQSMPTAGQSGTLGLSGEGDGPEIADSERGQGGASRTEPLTDKPLGEWLPHDSEQLDRLIEPLQARLRRKLIRRYRRGPHASRIDLRESIRKAMGTSGEVVRLQTRKRQTVMPNVYILVDVSHSMETHAQFFLRMARSFCQVMRARAFVFHTSLIEVTDLLKRNSGRVQEKINSVTFGFGGGTRIASNLHRFIEQAKRGPNGQRIRGLGRRDLVFVLSDGFDTDPHDQLAVAVQDLRRLGAELYWLHPTLDVPQSRAIESAQAHISGFLGISHLDSLNGLVDLIARRHGYDVDQFRVAA
ncbi:MAG: VWA domain-containing protein [Burkholderiaceae bacterium]|nr:VWA domain-containing protein [Burkholderiaceae bacterium]MCD8564507.1 VWA domain-containing protein [Burkholderiaceae bacterium]